MIGVGPRRSSLGVSLLLMLALGSHPAGQDVQTAGYRVGDHVDPKTQVLTRNLAPKTLSEIVSPETKVVALIIFGGGAPTAPEDHPLRGGIWCPDSFDDLPLQRALIRHFKDEPVQFVAVAAPPVYSDVFGFVTDIFTTRGNDDPELVSQIQTFIELTEKTKENDVLPFDEVFYDPKFRLAQDRSREVGPQYGRVYDWQGRLRWHLDSRKYGTPSIWILDPRLKVLRAPFVGNDYNADPPRIRYDFRDVRQAIQSVLK